MSKTIKEWLSELPEPYKTQALGNTGYKELNNYAQGLPSALDSAFCWGDSPEGHQYWCDYHFKLTIAPKPVTNALQAIQAIALKKGFVVESIESVERWRESADDNHWRYRLIIDSNWQVINLSTE